MTTTKTDRIYDDYSVLTPVHDGIDLTRVMPLIAEELELYQKRTVWIVPTRSVEEPWLPQRPSASMTITQP